MFAIWENGTARMLSGFYEFSDTVYQTAESLTPEQREQFSVYEVVDNLPIVEKGFELDGLWDFRLDKESGVIIRSCGVCQIPEIMKDKLKSEKEDELWSAANDYQTKFISGVAIGILTIGVIQKKPKAIAIQQWTESIWNIYYQRKSTLDYDTVVDKDFSSCGTIPYSIPELRAEVEL